MPKPIYHEQSEWDAVRVVKVDGERVERHVIEIKPKHVGMHTLGCGNIQRGDVGRFYVVDSYQDRSAGPVDHIVDVNPLARSIASEPSWIISFLDKNKRTIDHAVIKAPSRNDARRRAIDLYAQNGDKWEYAGFVVSEKK